MAKKVKPHKQPFLPLFVGDFLGATDEWEGEEQGLYLACMARQWVGGSLPADPVKLCRQLKWSQPNFDRYWPVVSRKFVEFEDPETGLRLRNLRLEEHREKSIEIGKKNAAAGKKGAERKWAKDGERHTQTMADAIPKDGARHKSAIPKVMAPGYGNPSHPIPSHPDPSQVLPPSSQDPSVCTPSQGADSDPDSHTRREANGSPGAQQTAEPWSDEAEHAEWEATAALYPPGAARVDWLGAEHHARKLVEDGHATWDGLRAGVTRYASHCAATNRMVLNPVKFFSDRDKPWAQAWPIQKQPAGSKLEDEFMRRTDRREATA